MEENRLTPIGEVRESFLKQLERVDSLDTNDENYDREVKYLNTLGDLEVEMAKVETASREKNEQVVEQKKDRYIRAALDVFGVVVPIVFYGIWMKRGFEFEKEGTFTSTTFRGLFGKFKPTRK
jgi:hypothetical protein